MARIWGRFRGVTRGSKGVSAWVTPVSGLGARGVRSKSGVTQGVTGFSAYLSQGAKVSVTPPKFSGEMGNIRNPWKRTCV
jgi:hypothetical protein